MRLLINTLAFLVGCSNAYAQDEAWNVEVYCDAAKSKLSIGDKNDSGLQDMQVDWPEIPQGPEVSPGGSMYRHQSQTYTFQCGVYTLKLSMDALNANPDGAEGIATFKTAEIYFGDTLILPKTGFYSCEFMSSRYERGYCPKYFVRNMDVQYDLRRKRTNILLHHEYFPDSNLSVATKTIEKYSVPNKH